MARLGRSQPFPPVFKRLYLGAENLNPTVKPTVGTLLLSGVASINNLGLIGTVGAITLSGVAGSLIRGSVANPTVGSLITYQQTYAQFTTDHPASISTTSTQVTWNSFLIRPSARANIGKSSGSYYAEFTKTAGDQNEAAIGVANISADLSTYVGGDNNGWGYYAADNDSTGLKFHNNVSSSYGAGYTTGDVIGMLLEFDGGGTGTLTFFKNGVSQGVAYNNIPAGTYYPTISGYYISTSQVIDYNFAVTKSGADPWGTQSGLAPTLNFGIFGSAGALVLTGIAPTVTDSGASGTSITTLVGTLTLAGVAGRNDRGIIGVVGSLVFSGIAPTVNAGGNVQLTPQVAALLLTGAASTLNFGLISTVGALTLAGVVGRNDRGVIGSVGGLTVSGVAPRNDYGLLGTEGQLVITGVAGRNDRGIISTVGSLTLSGVAGSLVRGSIIGPTVGAITLVGGSSLLNFGLFPQSGQLVFASLVALNTSLTPLSGLLVLTGIAGGDGTLREVDLASYIVLSMKTDRAVLDGRDDRVMV